MKRIFFTLPLIALTGSAFAQLESPEKQLRFQREEAAQRDATQAAREAAKRRAGEGEDVTWEQVMARPDDLDLNYRFAQTQVRQGNLKGAAGTLERMLLVNPNLPKIRLFYALVLFRLGDLNESERELRILKK